MIIVYKAGAWDPLHAGHINVLNIAATLGDRLIVGVAADAYLKEYKQREVFYPLWDRMHIMSELRMVDIVIPYSGPEDLTPIDTFGVDIRVVDEYYGKGDSYLAVQQRKVMDLLRMRGVKIVVIPRTPYISSTKIRESMNV